MDSLDSFHSIDRPTNPRSPNRKGSPSKPPNKKVVGQIPVAFREPTMDDMKFVIDSWLKNYFRYAYRRLMIRGDIFFHEQRRLIESIRANVVICCNPSDPAQVYGYAVGGDLSEFSSVIHFIYVKEPFRFMGIGAGLLKRIVGDKKRIYFTHYTRAGGEWAEKVNAIFNPYLLHYGSITVGL